MNDLAQYKISLISWIAGLQDIALLKSLLQLQIQQNHQKISTPISTKRQAGWGKQWILYIADDFDDTPPGFEEYTQ